MKNIILSAFIITLFVGCSSKEEKILMQEYKKNKSYHQQLQKTEKIQLYDGSVTKVFLSATYINKQNVEIGNEPDEVFVVGIYIDEDIQSDEMNESEEMNQSIYMDTCKDFNQTRENNTSDDANVTKDKVFHQEGFVLKLNKKNYTSIKKLERGDPLLKDLSFLSEWNDFYLVTFPYTKKRSFKLKFKSDLYGKGKLHFSKVAKYVLTKKGF